METKVAVRTLIKYSSVIERYTRLGATRPPDLNWSSLLCLFPTVKAFFFTTEIIRNNRLHHILIITHCIMFVKCLIYKQSSYGSPSLSNASCISSAANQCVKSFNWTTLPSTPFLSRAVSFISFSSTATGISILS